MPAVGRFRVPIALAFLIGGCGSALPAPTSIATPRTTPSPTATAPSPTDRPSVAPAAAFREWTRIDMPDPAPGVYGGGTPSSVVGFKGGYVAAGTVFTDGCDGGDPASRRGVLWTSVDGSSWIIHDPIKAFEHASIGLLTDGSRLVAAGSYALPIPNERIPAVWTSTDGVTWVRTTGDAPSFVAVGGTGFVGAFADDSMPGPGAVRFASSIDGLAWTVTSPSFDVDLRGLAAGTDGAALAIGAVPGPPRADGSPTTDVVIYRSADGTSWTGPETLAHEAMSIALRSQGASFFAIVDMYSQLPNGSIASTSELWRLDPGAGPVVSSIPLGDEEPIDRIWVLGDAVIAGGLTLVGEVANAMLLVSIDGGGTWGRVLYQDAFGGRDNELSGIAQIPNGLLGVGRRWDIESAHPVPQAWISLR